jgi:hypothetical protein
MPVDFHITNSSGTYNQREEGDDYDTFTVLKKLP